MKDMRKKIKQLELYRQRPFWVLAGIEILLLLLCISGLFGKNAVYEYGVEQMTANFGVYDEGQGGYVADAAAGQTGNLVDFSNIALPKGVYRVCLSYATDANMQNMCTVTDDSVAYNGLLTNGEMLYSGLEQTDFEMWLLQDTSSLIVHARYNQGNLAVKGLTIYQTNAGNRIILFLYLCLILIVDSIYLFRKYDAAYGVPIQQKNVILGVLAIVVMASIPLMTNYIVNSGDIGYHLLRIEGLKDGILSGQFPVRIAPDWQQGNGYADAVFYGQTLLLPAALLRMIGFTVNTSYRIYMLLINAATAWLSYYCFQKIFKERYVGLLCSMLHTLSVYRLYKTYMCGALGETLGSLFLPLIVYGFYRVFTEDIHSKEYKWSFLPLLIGFAGIIQSHMLTCEIVGGFTILLCIILWKRVFRKETFWALAKAAVGSVLVAAWFVVPFLDYMLTGDFVIHHVSGRTIQERGLYLAHLFSFPTFAGPDVFPAENGMVGTAPMGIGFALLAVWLAWGYLRNTGRIRKSGNEHLTAEEIALGRILGIFAGMAMLMSLSLFPWDRIQFLNRITATLVSSLQFPNRFLTLGSVACVGLAGVIGIWIWRRDRTGCKALWAGALIVLTFMTSVYMETDFLYKKDFMRVYNDEGMGNGYISGAEYLPYGTDATQLIYRAPIVGGDVEIEGYEKGPLTVEVSCRSYGAEGSLNLPLLYYKGYRAYDADTGEELEVYDGVNHTVHVKVPEGYEGTVRTTFVSPWYWRLAEAISLISGVGLAVWYHLARRRVISASGILRSGQ